ncbi:MAG: hypothetical protein V3S89_14355, partial [Desulfobacterales bacterium]
MGISKRTDPMETIERMLSDQKGFILPIGLMFLAVLGVMGTTAMVVTTTDIRIGMNHRASVQAHYAAVAGYEETRARLALPSSNVDYIGLGTPDADWRGYIGDTTVDFGSDSYISDADHVSYAGLQGGLDYTVMIKYKTDVATGNLLLWGDDDGDYVNTVNMTDGLPIVMIESRGTVDGSSRTITVEARGSVPFFDPVSALYVNGNLDKNGNRGTVRGDMYT